MRIRGRAAMGLLDLRSREYSGLDIPIEVPVDGGVTGLATSPTRVFAIVQIASDRLDAGTVPPSALLIFDRRDFALRQRYVFAHGRDIHSISLAGDVLYAVSTGTDEVLSLQLRGDEVVSETVVWSPESAEFSADIHHVKADGHHLNSVCLVGGDLVVGGFGPKPGELWSSASDGFVFNIGQGTTLRHGLKHPHSLVAVGDALAVCESREMAVHLPHRVTPVLVDGYTRGLCRLDDAYYAGISRRRSVSKSTGQTLTSSEETGGAGIIRISDDGTVEQVAELRGFADELYDLLPIADVEAWPRRSLLGEIGSREAAIASLQEAVATRATWGIRLQEIVAERDREINTLSGAIANRDKASRVLVSEKDALGSRLAIALADLNSVRTSFNDLQQAHDVITAHSRAISSSMAWKFARMAWRLRSLIAPRGTRRDRGVHLTKRGAAILAQAGPVGLLRRVAMRLTQKDLLTMPIHATGSSANSDRPSVVTPISAKYDVIVLPIIDWEFRFQRPQQIATRLAAAGHRVFYVRTTFADIAEGEAAGLQGLGHDVYGLQLPGPVSLNIYRGRPDALDVARWIDSIERLRRDARISEAVCLVDLPYWTPLAITLRSHFGWRVVYDCMDRHAGFSTNDASMLELEDQLTRESDLVVVTSQTLLEEHQPQARATLLLPNAADYDHFNMRWSDPPADLGRMPHPIIGYYGAIADWFDADLVAAAARAHPEWSFVLVGSTFNSDLSVLKALANVHLFGEQPYELLPGFLHAFDVATIPFRLTSLIEATNPVKFYEYLSAGKPVVSVPLPELVPHAANDLVTLASDAVSFVHAIERVLEEDSAELATRRQEFARANTWEQRTVELRAHVAQLYPRITVIVLSYGNLDLTRRCIDSIERNSLWPNLELILVDNASPDGTQSFLREFGQTRPDVKLILNDENVGFARANNQGMREATGEYIVLLNNDTIVTRGWLGRLVRHLQRDATLGLVGPVTNGAGNEARVDVTYTSLQDMEAFAEQRALEFDGRAFDIRMLALFCAAMRRTLLDEIGLLDERYEVGMFEDDDFALRIHNAGYHLACAEDVFIHHFHGAAFKALRSSEYQRLFEANRRRFEEKWERPWEPHRYRPVAEAQVN